MTILLAITLLQWMDGIAQGKLAQRDAEIAAIRTPAQATQRRIAVRKKVLDLIGGLPDYRGPLHARVTSRRSNEAYRLETVIFESLPNFFVTANLYLPNQSGRHPAVLLSSGHSIRGKSENNQIAANLAAKGFVALTYDPIGLGERVQAYDRLKKRGWAGCCANEHLQAGAQSLLIGQSVARHFIWDAMRALDYLESRPEVDGSRLGAAGCSGGGCLTTYIAALDPRIKAAAPACFLNTLKVLFTGPYPDSEMSLPGFLAAGLDHADFLEMPALIPWLVLATEGDFFTPAGVRPVYEEARRWYRLHGVEERVAMLIAPGPHGTPRETREAIYKWMIRWLASGKGNGAEQDLPLYTEDELVVTKSGQVEDEPGSKWLYQVIRDEFRSKAEPLGAGALREELQRLGIVAGRPAPAQPAKRPGLLIVKTPGSEAWTHMADAQGAVVMELEPPDTPESYDKRPYLGNWMVNARANSIGENLPALRAREILSGVNALSARQDVDPARIRAAASGTAGVWLLLAAAADPRIGRIWLDRTPSSVASSLDQPVNTNLFDAMIPGFLLHWDLRSLEQLMGKRAVLRSRTVDWMGHELPGPPSKPPEAMIGELLRN